MGKTKKVINENITRLGDDLLYVDVISTSEGNVRIGSMAEISKLMREYRLEDSMVVVLPPKISQAGDNSGGEEFVMWNAIFLDKRKRFYIGKQEDVEALYNLLNITQPGYFSDDFMRIIHKSWLDDYFIKYYLNERGIFKRNSLEIKIDNNVLVFENNQLLYDYNKFKPNIDIGRKVDQIFNKIRRDSSRVEELQVLVVGSGNGFVGNTSSFIVMYGDRKIWIDPCARPYKRLPHLKIHIDDITDILITHNHEDHYEGFSAVLQRAIEKGRKINLITTRSIYKTLKRQLNNLFSDIDKYIQLIELNHEKILEYHDGIISSRNNHHVLDYGTIGLKISFNRKTVGISGDHKYRDDINKNLKDPKLFPQWFEDSNLVFHEVDFKNPKTIHTYYEDLGSLRKVLKCQLLVYHVAESNPPIKIAEEGKVYKV